MTAYQNSIKNLEIQRARTAVYDALRAGRMVKPCACESCGTETTDLEAHHSEYSKPLDVIWLCTQCHANVHKEMRAQAWKELGGKYKRMVKAEAVGGGHE